MSLDIAYLNDAAFMVCPPPDTDELEKLFCYEVFKMLKAEGKITDVIIGNKSGVKPCIVIMVGRIYFFQTKTGICF